LRIRGSAITNSFALFRLQEKTDTIIRCWCLSVCTHQTHSMQLSIILFCSAFLVCLKGLRISFFSSLFNKKKQFLGQTTPTTNYSRNEVSFNVQFTLSESSHSALKSTFNFSSAQCDVFLPNNSACRSSSTPCFDYRTINNTRYCASGMLCSIMESCDNATYNCASDTSVCIINSCCSPQAICLPLSFTRFCSPGNNIIHRTSEFL
jgi:hypothetical protein